MCEVHTCTHTINYGDEAVRFEHGHLIVQRLQRVEEAEIQYVHTLGSRRLADNLDVPAVLTISFVNPHRHLEHRGGKVSIVLLHLSLGRLLPSIRVQHSATN